MVTILRYLPRGGSTGLQQGPYGDPGNVSYSEVGGLSEQIRELGEVIELHLTSPELFQHVEKILQNAVCYMGLQALGKYSWQELFQASWMAAS